jgi:hypothetical protein
MCILLFIRSQQFKRIVNTGYCCKAKRWYDWQEEIEKKVENKKAQITNQATDCRTFIDWCDAEIELVKSQR